MVKSKALFPDTINDNDRDNQSGWEPMPAKNDVRFRTVFDNTPIGIAIVSADGKFIEVNNAFYNMLGYSKDDVLNLTIIDITYPPDRPETEKLNRAVTAGNNDSYQIEKRYLTKDGKPVWTIARATAVRDNLGNIQYWIALMEDISEKRNSEAALRESEEKYRNILDSIEEGYYEVNLKGNLTFFNNAVCKLSGYSREELGRINNRDYTSPATARKMLRIYNRVYRTGNPAKIEHFEIIAKTGEKKYLELSASLLRDSENNPSGFRGVFRDVTDRLLALEERDRLISQIQQGQKMEAIGTLAGGIAHDFNNLLMGLQGNISLMMLDKQADNPDYEYLQNMGKYIQRGSELTRQILGFARGGKYEVKATDLNFLLENSLNLFSRTKKEIKIHRKFQENIWTVDVDRGQIEQVVLNLFVNAWQAMPGGGDLFVETENITLDESSYKKPFEFAPGNYVKMTVTDTGVGMDQTTRDRVFEPFFTTKGVGKGTGLGMASAYGIIKNHGGIINVYSEKGHGSVFRIYLPVSGGQVTEQTAGENAVLKGKETILLVDDEQMVANIGKGMLEKLGYRVLLAGNGTKALDIFQKHSHHIGMVILDMIMPTMSGSETYERLKKIQPEVKVLLCSGYSIRGQASEILQRGCNGFIQKPFNIESLSKKVREVLDG